MLADLVAAFGLGIGATLSPCALPLYPGFLAYLSARPDAGPAAKWLGPAVLAGVLTMMLALGGLIAALSVAAGRVLVVVTPLADLAVIALGLALLAGADPFARLPMLAGRTGPAAGGAGAAVRAAFAYGLLYGPIALPCFAAFVVAIFTLSLSVGSFAAKLAVFVVFGLGFGLPLLGLSVLAAARRRALVRAFARHGARIGRLAGIVLVLVGAADLASNADSIRLYLGI